MKSSWRFEWNLQSRAFYLSVHYAFEGGSNFEYEDTNSKCMKIQVKASGKFINFLFDKVW